MTLFSPIALNVEVENVRVISSQKTEAHSDKEYIIRRYRLPDGIQLNADERFRASFEIEAPLHFCGRFGRMGYQTETGVFSIEERIFDDKPTRVDLTFGRTDNDKTFITECIVFFEAYRLEPIADDRFTLPYADVSAEFNLQKETAFNYRREDLMRTQRRDIETQFDAIKRSVPELRMDWFALPWYASDKARAEEKFRENLPKDPAVIQRIQEKYDEVWRLFNEYFNTTVTVEGEEEFLARKQADEQKNQIRQTQWEAIKQKRDAVTKGGILINNKWFGTDAESCTRYNRILDGAEDEKGQLTCLDGSQIDYTKTFIQDIVTQIGKRENDIYRIAEHHRQAMEKSDNPQDYDFSENWPPVYQM